MQCGHCICTACLETLAAQGEFVCPLCGMGFRGNIVGQTFDTSFPKNYQLQAIVDEFIAKKEEYDGAPVCCVTAGCQKKTFLAKDEMLTAEDFWVCKDKNCGGSPKVVCSTCLLNFHDGHQTKKYTNVVSEEFRQLKVEIGHYRKKKEMCMKKRKAIDTEAEILLNEIDKLTSSLEQIHGFADRRIAGMIELQREENREENDHTVGELDNELSLLENGGARKSLTRIAYCSEEMTEVGGALMNETESFDADLAEARAIVQDVRGMRNRVTKLIDSVPDWSE